MTLRSFGFGLELVTPGKVRDKAASVNGYLRFLNEQMVEDAPRLGNDFFSDWTLFFNDWQTYYTNEILTPRILLSTMGNRLTQVEQYEQTGKSWQAERDIRLQSAPPPPIVKRDPPPKVETKVPPVVKRTPPTTVPPVTRIPPPTTPPPVKDAPPPAVPPTSSGPGVGTVLLVGAAGVVALLLVKARS